MIETIDLTSCEEEAPKEAGYGFNPMSAWTFQKPQMTLQAEVKTTKALYSAE